MLGYEDPSASLVAKLLCLRADDVTLEVVKSVAARKCWPNRGLALLNERVNARQSVIRNQISDTRQQIKTRLAHG